jgi:hypothetical protein
MNLWQATAVVIQPKQHNAKNGREILMPKSTYAIPSVSNTPPRREEDGTDHRIEAAANNTKVIYG